MDWLSTAEGSMAVASALTLIACLESRWVPWSPFILIYALLALAIPLAVGSPLSGDPIQALANHAGWVGAIALCMFAWEHVLASWLYERKVLVAFGLGGDPFHSPKLAMDFLIDSVRRGCRLSPKAMAWIYGGYTLLWAPVAEELFYWGYLYANLRATMDFLPAASLASAFFGLRHAAHFLYLGRKFPAGAAGWIVLSVFVTGLMNSYLIEMTQSLYPSILLHFLSNFVLAGFALRSSDG